jgi:hypothetical protein
MNARTKARIGSASALALINIFLRRWLATYWHRVGVSAFLAYQSRQFAKWCAGPESLIASIARGIFFPIAALVIYELLARGIYAIIRQEKVGDGT